MLRLFVPAITLAVVAGAAPRHEAPRSTVRTLAAVDSVVPNDNRIAAGAHREGAMHVRLEARLARWRPDLGVDTTVTVMTFAEQGGAPRIPGPLIRATSGTEIRVSVRNALPDSTLVLHGLRAGTTGGPDTLHVPPGGVRHVAFHAGAPGTYLYWGTTTNSPIFDRPWRDSQLTGAIVVDAADTPPDSAERIFVMTVIDLYAGDTVRNKAKEDIWELAINGRSWPHTERLEYGIGDTVRWRWVNGGYLPHPMHLHGFHFRVTAKGDGVRDTLYDGATARLAVTELMTSGSTFAMEWVPTREGSWLMHCHMIPHITPFPERPDSIRAHDGHEVERHPLSAMSGLVLGITIRGVGGRAAPPVIARRLRVFAQERPGEGDGLASAGFVLQRGAAPSADSVQVPGPPLVLVRGETTAITVINRLREATTIHWHGMELESVFDGVAGWSRSAGSIAPLLAPGDSFTVVMTPPRAGTFIYHTHMDEGRQLGAGMYGPLLVMEPGETFDAATDLVVMIGTVASGKRFAPALNGLTNPAPLDLRAGTRYRLRMVNILFAPIARIDLAADTQPLEWTTVAKDGAEIEITRRATTPSQVRIGVGETYDFEWTPDRPMDAVLTVRVDRDTLRQAIRVRP